MITVKKLVWCPWNRKGTSYPRIRCMTERRYKELKQNSGRIPGIPGTPYLILSAEFRGFLIYTV
jgi:hypothetical protein